MSIAIINDIFSDEELEHIRMTIANSDFEIDTQLGRITTLSSLTDTLEQRIIDKFTHIVREIGEPSLVVSSITAVEYNGMYGKPNLPPHFDGDFNDLIINMQVLSNTVWDLGLNSEVYSIEDNSALVFNANKEIHWRVNKEFKDGEYVIMMFVRFCKLENRSDYSHLRISLDDPIYKDARDFRDSYPQPDKA